MNTKAPALSRRQDRAAKHLRGRGWMSPAEQHFPIKAERRETHAALATFRGRVAP